MPRICIAVTFLSLLSWPSFLHAAASAERPNFGPPDYKPTIDPAGIGPNFDPFGANHGPIFDPLRYDPAGIDPAFDPAGIGPAFDPFG